MRWIWSVISRRIASLFEATPMRRVQYTCNCKRCREDRDYRPCLFED